MKMKNIFTITFFACVAVFVYNIFLDDQKTKEDSPVIVTEKEDVLDGIGNLDTALDTDAAAVNKKPLQEVQDKPKALSNMKTKEYLKELKPQEIQLNTKDIIETESPMARGAAKSYKEVTTLELKGESAFKLMLDQSLNKVGSVVLVSLDGPMLIHNFSANERSNKGFKEGQETMKGDWVKLDNIQGGLKSIELKAYSESNNRVRVYVQYFGDERAL